MLRADLRDEIRANIDDIRERIEQALSTEGLVDPVRLMAVTKTVDPERINAALDCGIDLIGENKVQEYLGKREYLKLDGVETHLIGHLQSNKASKIVGEVDLIESLDSVSIIKAVSDKAVAKGIRQKCLIEINIGREDSKTGFLPEETDEALESVTLNPGVEIVGLMCVAPICEKESELRAFFSQMHKIFIDKRSEKSDNINMTVLSMGMSSDYVEAVKEGATLVRVGSGIFGSRRY